MKRIMPLAPGNALSQQCKTIRKQRKGRKKKIFSGKGDGVDVRGLTAKERSTLAMIKFRGWL